MNCCRPCACPILNTCFHFKGSISVVEALDYETCKDFYLVVEAKDGGSPALSAVTTVNINVTDVNDNAPRFSQEVYSAVISEDAAVGDSVITVSSETSTVYVCQMYACQICAAASIPPLSRAQSLLSAYGDFLQLK